jgi:hypothetical protein
MSLRPPKIRIRTVKTAAWREPLKGEPCCQAASLAVSVFQLQGKS